MSYLLDVRNLSVYYGVVRALENVSFYIEIGEIVTLIGPNGAGKSTALKAICGLVAVNSGEIKFRDDYIRGSTPDALVKKGLSLVPEGRRIFPTMTVLENLEMGAYTRIDKSSVKESIEKTLTLFPRLKERTKQKAGTLSGGEQQMLAIGRALMLKPLLLLLDEPSLGLSPNYVEIVFDKLLEINQNGTSILLVEQNAQMALQTCHRGYVFNVWFIEIEGEREKLIKDENIKRVFLGG